MKTFEFIEDKKYFVDLLCGGDEVEFDRYYSKFFDFRNPQIKRNELNVRKIKIILLGKQNSCQLKLSPTCSGIQCLQVEHLIPISTNKLNKKLRNIKASPGKKVPTQSYGSNHLSNLILACEKCNSMKKHRLPDEFPVVIELIKKRANDFN
jgi:5-methylcytosine-specific restriction endonuclease McrA